MQRKAQSHNSIFGIAWNSVLALMLVLLVLIGRCPVHSFYCSASAGADVHGNPHLHLRTGRRKSKSWVDDGCRGKSLWEQES